MAQVIRFIPNAKIDLTPHLRELHTGELPWLSGWQVIETPGHTAGHVSFFRREDGALLAGDAFTTMNQDSMIGTLSRRQQVWRPPAYYTPDWQSAAASVRRLAELSPNVLAAGHGVPMSGTNALEQLRELARDFPIPEYGRYIHEPALTDQNGITYLPPPVPDLVKRTALIGAAAAGAIAAGIWLATRPAKKQREDVGWRKAA
jgi:glyoxylase-like metal-dependent hydrolase (beta-lactamase superfamily II)